MTKRLQKCNSSNESVTKSVYKRKVLSAVKEESAPLTERTLGRRKLTERGSKVRTVFTKGNHEELKDQEEDQKQSGE